METELKLEAAADDIVRLAGAPPFAGEPVTTELTATYFDTPARDLREAGLTLRVRHDGAHWTQTVKAEGAGVSGLFVRPEWEREVPGGLPVIDAASGPVEAVLEGRPVEPAFTVQVSRSRWMVERDGSRIEVALDRGTVSAGERIEPIAELEFELMEGAVAALFALAREVDGTVPLRLGVLSKAERGHRLRDDARAAAKAGPVLLDRPGDPASALATIAHACLRQFRLNEAILLHGETGAAPLHQARVGLRRLRSALSLFKPLLAGDPRAAEFAAGLRTLSATLGQVRDLDVLIGQHTGPVGERLTAARGEAYAEAVARLQAPETPRLMLDLVEWLANGVWRTQPAGEASNDLPAFAADLLARRRKRLKRRGKHLAALDEHHCHQVRIEAKKLRYAAEFFGGLWPGKKARRRHKAFLAAIEALQEELGTLNDAATAPIVFDRLGITPEPPATTSDAAGARKRAEKAHKALLKVDPFWR